MGLEHDAIEWRLLLTTEVSKEFFYVMEIVFPVSLFSSNENNAPWKTDNLLSGVYYQEHKWLSYGDLKVVELVLGLQV